MYPKVILIHHHIFKNAGTSFNHSLRQFFQDRFAEYDLPNSQIVTHADLAQFIDRHPQILAISSHHACMPGFAKDNYQTVSSVLLRNPLSRIESIYQFERKQTVENPGTIKAKELDFKAYVEWRLAKTPLMFCNYQTHYCSRSSASDRRKPPTKIDLKKAIANLHQCTVVGVVERYQDSLEAAAKNLQKYYQAIALSHYRLNTTANTNNTDAVSSTPVEEQLIAKLGRETVTYLEANNQLDFELYRVATDILDRSLN